jgi:hypothetical protein
MIRGNVIVLLMIRQEQEVCLYSIPNPYLEISMTKRYMRFCKKELNTPGAFVVKCTAKCVQNSLSRAPTYGDVGGKLTRTVSTDAHALASLICSITPDTVVVWSENLDE